MSLGLENVGKYIPVGGVKLVVRLTEPNGLKLLRTQNLIRFENESIK
jgi:hypothetical protein